MKNKRKNRGLLTAICAAALLICSAPFVTGSAADARYELDGKGNIDTAAYFRTENGRISSESTCVRLGTENAGYASFSFIKPLMADGLTVRFNGNEKLEKVIFTITDSEKEAQTLKTEYKKYNASASALRLNETGVYGLTDGALDTRNESDMYFLLDLETNLLTDRKNSLELKKYASGDVFTGFSSAKVNLKIEVYGTDTALSVTSINNQRFGSNYTTDTTAPWIDTEAYCKNVCIGTVVKTPKAFALDVIAYESQVTLTVKDPTGEIVRDIDGTPLENVDGGKSYSVRIDRYGTYSMLFFGTDGTKSASSSKFFIASDRRPPSISVRLESRYPLGKTISIEYETTDNLDGEAAVSFVSVMTPQGVVNYVGNLYTFKQAGYYTFTFTAVDAGGNVARVERTVEVS